MNSNTTYDSPGSQPAGTTGETTMRRIACIGTERPSDGSGRMRACILQAAPEAAGQGRRFALNACANWDITGDTRESLRLIVSELVTNAAVHGNSDYVALALWFSTKSLRIEVIDAGRWLHRPQNEMPTESGRGLQIVEALSDRMTITTTAGGTHVQVDLAVPSGDLITGRARATRPAQISSEEIVTTVQGAGDTAAPLKPQRVQILEQQHGKSEPQDARKVCDRLLLRL
ncbi:ATP-binding protein [Streptomyces chartreusis]